MADLRIRLRDAYREPLADRVDVTVTAHRTGRVVAQVRDKAGDKAIRVPNLAASDVYVVQVYPARHRPVGRFVLLQAGGTAVEIDCPADANRVRGIEAPAWATLSPRARAVLEATALDGSPLRGQALYESEALDFSQKAGLLNLLAKMEHTPLPGGGSVLDRVDSLYRVRGDRVFANVALGLRDQVKSGVASGLFAPVSGSLHKPDPAFALVDSYKTRDPYGNLQLTFFASLAAPLRFTADIDIDDALGIGHLFQVIEHTLEDSATSPFDIHEILVYHQFLDPGYGLVLA